MRELFLPKPLPIGVLVSGSGTNLQAILEACQTKAIAATVAIVISSNPQAFALTRAKKAGVPTHVVDYPKGNDRKKSEEKIIQILNQHGVKLVVLAGFMKLLSPLFVSQFQNRILNVHPALLPAFPGLNAIRQALEAKASVTGVTVHLVDEGCDTGPIVLQETVKILPGDTEESLSQKIHAVEHQLLPKAIDLFAKNKVRV